MSPDLHRFNVSHVLYPLLAIAILLQGCTSDDSSDSCDPDPFACSKGSVQLCNDGDGNVYWLVSDGQRFDCGSGSVTNCTQQLTSYCRATAAISGNAESGMLVEELTAALVKEKQRSLDAEAYLHSLNSDN